MSNTFAIRAATDQRLLKRSCETLLGLCSGILADGQLVDEEIRFLDTWLADNDDISSTWPGEVIVTRIRDILSDGVITEEEREYLKMTLSDLLGGTLEETGATSGIATRLPVDDIETIVISDNLFCFTGNFLYGTRKACERAIVERGGEASSSIRTNLNYLVIGTLVSRDWANTSHGRKIEKAIDYKNKGRPIQIVSEEQWVQFI
jgi:NAD-dependent DNA ligase